MLRLFQFTLLFFPSFASAQNSPHEAYIEKYKDVAIQEMNQSGVPASIKLAQGLLESQYGKSELAVNANNHFGIKCKSTWQGATYYLEDDDFENDTLIKSCFRKYPDVLSSYIDHTDFLKSRPWYAPLFELNRRDYKSWAFGLKKAGYATDPLYAQKLISRIEQWQLNRFDNEKPIDLIRELPPAIIPLPAQTIITINGLKMVLAREGQTPAALAKLVGLPVTDILKYNEQLNNPNQILKRGEYIFLEKKKKKYQQGKLYHRATGNEDLYQISQRYGVTLERLARRNRMDQNAVPLKNEQIKLRGWRVKKSEAPKWSFKISVPPKSKDQSTEKTIYHTVLQGETLYGIARKYQTSVEKIKTVNGFESDILRIGQVLKIE